MEENEIQNIECDLLLNAIYRRYGYDFRNYAKASIRRRVKQFCADCNLKNISEAIPILLHDNGQLAHLLSCFSITVTEMFRDPWVYQTLREKVLPLFKKQPHIRIWHAGCATGEEVYSLAIMLEEEGLYDRCQIYATDLNDDAIKQAQEGIFQAKQIKEFTQNYQKSGGKSSFSDYYHCEYDLAILNKNIIRNVTFANHNLATDSTFGEMHMIICRNVLIYFDCHLQNRVFKLFDDSLTNQGILVLGTKESLCYYESASSFTALHTRDKIYQKLLQNDGHTVKKC